VSEKKEVKAANSVVSETPWQSRYTWLPALEMYIPLVVFFELVFIRVDLLDAPSTETTDTFAPVGIRDLPCSSTLNPFSNSTSFFGLVILVVYGEVIVVSSKYLPSALIAYELVNLLL